MSTDGPREVASERAFSLGGRERERDGEGERRTMEYRRSKTESKGKREAER